MSEEDNLIKLACEQLQSNRQEDSESDVLAKSWASQYEGMQGSQKILVRKIISDVLFHGCMKTIEMGHAVEIQKVLLRKTFTSESDVSLSPITDPNEDIAFPFPPSLNSHSFSIPYPTASTPMAPMTQQLNPLQNFFQNFIEH